MRMKAIKITKADLRKFPEDLLRKVGAVNEELKRAYPQNVFLAAKDYKEMTRNLRKRYKKERPYLKKKALDTSVGLHLLDFGPSELISEAVRPGYVLVDTDGIEAMEQRDRAEAKAEAEVEVDKNAIEVPKDAEDQPVPQAEVEAMDEAVEDQSLKPSSLTKLFRFFGV